MEIPITTYSELEQYIKAFKSNENTTLLLVIGSPGLAKTTTIKKVFHDNPRENLFINGGGDVSAFQLYCDLFFNKDKPVILDDCDSMWSNSKVVNLLRALTQTEKTRRIQWKTRAEVTMLAPQGIDAEFTTSSKVIVVNNHRAAIKSELMRSFRDRGWIIGFNPSAEEVLREAKTWFKNTEILKFVESNMRYIWNLSMRALWNANLARESLLNWERDLARELEITKYKRLEQLLSDPGISDEQRYEDLALYLYNDRMGDDDQLISRSHYFELKKRLAEMSNRKTYAPINTTKRAREAIKKPARKKTVNLDVLLPLKPKGSKNAKS